MASSLTILSSKFLTLRERLNDATASLGDAVPGDEKMEADHEVYADRLGRQMARLTYAIARTPSKSMKELVQKARGVMDWANKDGDLPDRLAVSLCHDVSHLHGDDVTE